MSACISCSMPITTPKYKTLPVGFSQNDEVSVTEAVKQGTRLGAAGANIKVIAPIIQTIIHFMNDSHARKYQSQAENY